MTDTTALVEELARAINHACCLDLGIDPDDESQAFIPEATATLPIIAREVAKERERCARIVEKRAEFRFIEHGTTEYDTNASYYSGRAGELYESLDKEDEAIAAAIRATEVTK